MLGPMYNQHRQFRLLKVARVATVPFFLSTQLAHQIKDLSTYGFILTAIASPEGDWGELGELEGLIRIPVIMARKPSLITDLVTMFKLYKVFKAQKFDVVHSTTPKAGLLSAIAAKLAGVPIRLHTFTGQTWATKSGAYMKLLCWLDKVVVKLNTQCYADSVSQRNYLNQHGVGDQESIQVLGEGSLAGVDLSRFNAENWFDKREQTLGDIGLSEGDFVVTYIGRLTREKGVGELLQAYESLTEKYSNFHLLLVGPIEDGVIEARLRELANSDNLHILGPTSTPEMYLSVSDLLCLPSYREGFGTVVIEAAAMRVPALGTNIVGLCDAIVDGETGLLVDARNVDELVLGLEKLLHNQAYCKQLGGNAYNRCKSEFDSKVISDLVANEYIRLNMRASRH